MLNVRIRRLHRGAAVLTLAIGTILAAGATTAFAQAVDKDLEARIAKEKADREGCKVKICDIARSKKADGEDVACKVVKTWVTDELKAKILRGKLDWPWGHAQCSADIKMPRKALAEALAAGEHQMKLDKHTLSCELDQKDGKDKYSISFAVAPVVTFKDGKAVKTVLNWSDITGSAVAKGAIWSAATLDNNLGVFEGAAVDAVNDFFAGSCDEIKDKLGK